MINNNNSNTFINNNSNNKFKKNKMLFSNSSELQTTYDKNNISMHTFQQQTGA